MPGKLAYYLPELSEEDRTTLFGSLYAVAAYPRGNPIREGVILGAFLDEISVIDILITSHTAYDEVMKILTIVATIFAVVPFVLAIWMPNWYLGDQQNAVENVDLAGEKVNNPDVVAQQP